MRIRALASFAVLGTLLGALGFAACSQGSAPATQSPDSGRSTGSDAPALSTGSGAEPASSATAAGDKFGECKSAVQKSATVDITNDPPDGGTVMNNAQTAGDAGSSDRLQKVIDVVKANRDKFRCCFDMWGKQNPGKEIKVTLALDLKPTGEVRTAGFKADETDLKDPTVEECMSEVSKSLPFPESPTGKDTTYNHRFNFKSHR